ncbi:MAG: hypothetical protein HUJ27_02750 [Rhodobacteraceae bacterium]|nr:hypothetical protein [Paracoccaceae bacterium]
MLRDSFTTIYGRAAPDGIVLPELLPPDRVMAAPDDAAVDEWGNIAR